MWEEKQILVKWWKGKTSVPLICLYTKSVPHGSENLAETCTKRCRGVVTCIALMWRWTNTFPALLTLYCCAGCDLFFFEWESRCIINFLVNKHHVIQNLIIHFQKLERIIHWFILISLTSITRLSIVFQKQSSCMCMCMYSKIKCGNYNRRAANKWRYIYCLLVFTFRLVR